MPSVPEFHVPKGDLAELRTSAVVVPFSFSVKAGS